MTLIIVKFSIDNTLISGKVSDDMYIFSSVIRRALVDKYGGKKVIASGVALWSLATLLTPWAANHSTASLLVVHAFFGLAEGVALPSMNTHLSRLFSGGTNEEGDSYILEWIESEGAVKHTYSELGKRYAIVVQFDTTMQKSIFSYRGYEQC